MGSQSLSPAGSTIPPGSSCQRHPVKAAQYQCIDCGAFTCATCDFELGPGQHLCPACVRQRREQAAAASTVASMAESGAVTVAAGAAPQPVAPAAPPPLPPQHLAGDVRCAQHAKVNAVATCDTCGAYMCATCIFEVPGGTHMCPVCAMAPKVVLSKNRKTALVLAYVLAVFSSIGTGLLLAQQLASLYQSDIPEFVANLIVQALTLFPALAGVALSVGSMDKKLGNTVALWAAAIWNMILVGVFMVMTVIGTLAML